jgi:predicted lysophospholipase L1 biosynthesis ABC-type transport system permease subunit
MKRFGGERVVLGAMFGSVRVNGAPAQPLFQVIGIVADAKYRSLREPFQPIVYQLPIPGDSFIVHLRTRSAPESVVPPMRRILSESDPRLSWIEVNTLESEVAASLWPERAAAFLATLFSAGAAMIVAVGLYALVAFSVIQRHREIGIRMALGAQPRNVIHLMFTRAALLAITGVGIGLVLARVAATQLTTILFEVQPHDVKVLISAAAGVLLVATLAAFIPASRGARVDPATVLREQ